MIARILNILCKVFGAGSIARYVAMRLLASVPVLLLITLVSFLMIRAIPGGPFVSSGTRPMPADVIKALERYYGLDRPLLLNLPGEPGWQLLHYVDEKVAQRIEVLDLSSDFKAAFDVVNADVVRAALGSRLDDAMQRITIYRASGVQRSELPGLLSDLAAIKDATVPINPAIAAHLD